MRSILNNNLLNIRRGAKWRGLKAVQLDESFCQFESMEWGLRAAFCILHTYAVRYHAYSIRDIVSRWAPPSENDTQRYIRNVCMWTGFGGNERLTEAQWPALVAAMARMESGTTPSDELVRRSFEMYKNAPKSPPPAPPKGGGNKLGCYSPLWGELEGGI